MSTESNSRPTSHFNRSQLAQQYGEALLRTSPGSASGSGLFLAAPRRTGKSTFVREDLRPELISRGAVVLYADLWADKGRDPGDVLVNAVRTELAVHDGLVARLAKSAGMDKVSVGGMGFSLDRVGLGADVSISAALSSLSDQLKRPIVFIIDEAQHAITTDKGMDALFALKAARDELNSTAHYGLRIVATGSNRDKLAMLRNSKDQAFFGALLINFPHLDDKYVRWFCDGVGLVSPLLEHEVCKLFERASFRPEILGAAADALRFDFNIAAADVNSQFAAAVNLEIQADRDRTLRVVRGLTSLQSCVLRVMASHGERYAPFEPLTVAAYRRVLDAIDPGYKAKLEAPNIQQALIALQERTLVWKEKRGIYALEESSTADLLAAEGMLEAVPGLLDMHDISDTPSSADRAGR